MIRLELQGRRPRESTKSRFMDTVKEHIKLVDGREEDPEDMLGWRQVIHCGQS